MIEVAAWTAFGCAAVLALTLAVVAYDDWRWRRALSTHADNQAAADRSVAQGECPQHSAGC